MAEMVNQRKRHFAEERAKAKRNKPMTQSQLRIYMPNYLKNQGTWKLSSLKKLQFEEIKEEFDKLVQQIDTFVPINLEATKAKLKRYGEELQTKTSKKQRFNDKNVPAIEEKVAEVKEEEQVKRTEKRKKQKARKGINVDQSAQEDSETDKEESVDALILSFDTNLSGNRSIRRIEQCGIRHIGDFLDVGTDTPYLLDGYDILRQCSSDSSKSWIHRIGDVIEEFRTRDEDLDIGIDDYPSYCDDDKKIHIDPREGNINEYWWRIYKSGNLEVLES
ncbi:hypothetical protein Tco_0275722 [Tanacetum coccineum]